MWMYVQVKIYLQLFFLYYMCHHNYVQVETISSSNSMNLMRIQNMKPRLYCCAEKQLPVVNTIHFTMKTVQFHHLRKFKIIYDFFNQ